MANIDPASCYTDGSHCYWHNNRPVAQIASLYEDPSMFVIVEVYQDGGCGMVGLFDHYPTVPEARKAWEEWING